MSNDMDDIKGRVKEGVGDITGNEDLEHEGRLDQAKATIKDGIDNVADKVRDLIKH